MKTIIAIYTTIALFLFVPVKAYATENVAGQSASISSILLVDRTVQTAKRKLVIRKVLERYNSPLIEYIDDFVNTCENYNLDCYLLPSITGLESTFGRFVLQNSYNPFGWGGGYIMFSGWPEAIQTVGKALKENYVNKGANTVEKIAPIYAESKTWAPRVNYFKTQFELEEEKIDLLLKVNKVNL